MWPESARAPAAAFTNRGRRCPIIEGGGRARAHARRSGLFAFRETAGTPRQVTAVPEEIRPPHPVDFIALSLLPPRLWFYAAEQLRAGTAPADVLDALLDRRGAQRAEREELRTRARAAFARASRDGLAPICWDAASYGLSVAGRLGSDLAAAGLVVVSGMARGVDSAAHRGALSAAGRTVAVLGSGVDVMYPPEHAQLAREIAVSGAVVSELVPGT